MKILLVADNCSKKMGGEAILPYHYFRLLKKKGYDVKMIVHHRNKIELLELFPEYKNSIFYISDTKLQKKMWNLGIKLSKRVSETTFGFLVFLLTNYRMKKKAEEMVKDFKIDIVHQVIPVSPKVPSFMYGLGAPVIVGPMNGGMTFPKGFHRFIKLSERISYGIGKSLSNIVNTLIPGKSKANLLLCANERTKNSLPYILKGKKVDIFVENGVDLALWKNESFEEPSSTLVEFTFVGRLVDWKGLTFLFNALKFIKSEIEIRLNIIGSGDQKENLIKLAKKFGLESKIIFHGFTKQEAVSKILNKSRALVLPSIYECGGAVVLEAMAQGIPVIATNWGGPADYLDECCGILVNPNSEDLLIEGLAKAMTYLLENPEVAKAMGENGRKKVEEFYDWDKKIETMLSYYEESIKSFGGK